MLIDDVKLSLRIKTSSLDEEISDLIEACKADLRISGIKVIVEKDPLIKRAIVVYCKANFGLDEKDSEKYQRSYDLLKEHMALCSEYNTEGIV
jgi:hypothetical protein